MIYAFKRYYGLKNACAFHFCCAKFPTHLSYPIHSSCPLSDLGAVFSLEQLTLSSLKSKRHWLSRCLPLSLTWPFFFLFFFSFFFTVHRILWFFFVFWVVSQKVHAKRSYWFQSFQSTWTSRAIRQDEVRSALSTKLIHSFIWCLVVLAVLMHATLCFE